MILSKISDSHNNFGITIYSISQPGVCLEIENGFEILNNYLFNLTPAVDTNDWKIVKNTLEIKRSNINFVDRYKSSYPQIASLTSYFEKIQDNDYFLIANGKIKDTETSHRLHSKLNAYCSQNGTTFKAKSTSLGIDLTGLLAKFNVDIFGQDRAIHIGGGPKESRICRFCNTKTGDTNKFLKKVNFKNKSHALSEALGNKMIKSLDECDACNERFGNTIELSLINLVSIFRRIYNLPGKGGQKTLKGINFTFNDEGLQLDYNGELTSETNEIKTELFPYNSKIIPQDIYRCLVKFKLSVAQYEDLKYLKETINWVNKEFDSPSLPEVYFVQDDALFTKHPYLMFLRRKTSDDNLPSFVGEFHYANLVFIFIIPFSSLDKRKFINPTEYQLLDKILIQPRHSFDWQKLHFFSINETHVAINLHVKTM